MPDEPFTFITVPDTNGDYCKVSEPLHSDPSSALGFVTSTGLGAFLTRADAEGLITALQHLTDKRPVPLKAGDVVRSEFSDRYRYTVAADEANGRISIVSHLDHHYYAAEPVRNFLKVLDA